MLKRYSLNQTNRPIDVVLHWMKEDMLELNPLYQRGDVWGLKRRQNLIRSILLGVPIPSIIINDRMRAEFSDGDSRYAVIDGKQRLTTLAMFLNDQFQVPTGWFDSSQVWQSSGWCVYGELSVVGQRKFKNHPIAFSEGRLETIAEEKEVFDLINFGGLAQGEVDSE